jgi:hypothetical protein
MYTTYRLGPRGQVLVEVLVTGTLAAYVAGQAIEVQSEGHVRPETHAEMPGSTPSFNVSVGSGGARTAMWDHGVWDRDRWG